jgi:hypothetical protein
MPVSKSTRLRPKICSFDQFVTVERFKPDIEFLLEVVVEQLAVPEHETQACLYVNPLMKVECDLPTAEFFAKAENARGQWCQRAKQMLGRRATRTTASWSAGHLMLDYETNFWHRAACLTGLMFIEGRFIKACNWSVKGRKATRYRSKRGLTHQEVFDKLLGLTSPDYWQTRFAEAGLPS